MSTLSINGSLLSPIQKRAVFKIAVELVKADKKIHSKEISVLDWLTTALDLSQQELDLVHYTSLAIAVESIKELDDRGLSEVLDLFNAIMKVDSDIDFEESLLLSSIMMSCSRESRGWASIISATELNSNVSERQIVYLEKEECDEAHRVLDDRYDNLLISKAFGDIGFQFFYLPNVLTDLGLKKECSANKFSLLQKSMEYLMPAGDKVKIENLENSLESFNTDKFFRVVASSLNLEPDFFPFRAFLLMKVRDSVILDDDNTIKNAVDFFCLDISSDVKKRILEFVANFDEQTYTLPYEGYYKILYDYFSSESKINSDIIIDSSYNFRLANLDNARVLFESAPQSKTLYLLLLHEGKKGVAQDVFIKAVEYLRNHESANDGLLDIEAFKKTLADIGTDWAKLIYNTISIYQTVSTKDEQKVGFLDYICSILSHRSSLKTYVNKGFSSISGLAWPEQYFIKFDKNYNTYSVTASTSLFHVCSIAGSISPISSSGLWKKLL